MELYISSLLCQTSWTSHWSALFNDPHQLDSHETKYNLQASLRIQLPLIRRVAFVAFLMKSFGSTARLLCIWNGRAIRIAMTSLDACCDSLLHNFSAMNFLVEHSLSAFTNQTKATWKTLLTNWKSPVLGRSHGQFTKESSLESQVS